MVMCPESDWKKRWYFSCNSKLRFPQAGIERWKVSSSRYNFMNKGQKRGEFHFFVRTRVLVCLEHEFQREDLRGMKPRRSVCGQILGSHSIAKHSYKDRKTATMQPGILAGIRDGIQVSGKRSNSLLNGLEKWLTT